MSSGRLSCLKNCPSLMRALIYAGSLKVIPAEHSSLIGTHSSRASVLGLSDGWAVPSQRFDTGVTIFVSFFPLLSLPVHFSLSLVYLMRAAEKMKTFDAATRLTHSKIDFHFFNFTELPHILTSFAPSVLYFIASVMALLDPTTF